MAEYNTSTMQRTFTKAANDMVKRLHMSVLKNMQNKMYGIAQTLVEYAMENREFKDFTGNLINAYAVRVYYKGIPLYTITSHEIEGKMPTMKTLKEGQAYYYKHYYDGRENRGYHKRSGNFIAKTGDERYYAFERALELLDKKKPSSKRGFSIVMVSGAKYAKFVEEVYNHDVLTNTFRYAPRLMRGNV